MSSLKTTRLRYLLFLIVLFAAIPMVASRLNTVRAISTVNVVHHYFYVFPQGSMYVYDMDNGFKLAQKISLPTGDTRGVVYCPRTGMLYISHGGTGGQHGAGYLLKYNLSTHAAVWNVKFPSGVDSMAITPNGETIYMPDGDQNLDGKWFVVNAITGEIKGTIVAGGSPHNTQVSADGRYVYLGAINYNYLTVVDTLTNRVIHKIGPLKAGVRPFTFNHANTLAFTNATDFTGFQVGSVATGNVLYTVGAKGFATPPGGLSHGISLSPDEKEIYLMDAPNSYVHVYDVSGLPSNAPRQVADIKLTPITGQQNACVYDCQKEGWVLHSVDGRHVFVANSGDVINTATRKIEANLPALVDSRIYLEIDWSGNAAVAATTRHGIGHA